MQSMKYFDNDDDDIDAKQQTKKKCSQPSVKHIKYRTERKETYFLILPLIHWHFGAHWINIHAVATSQRLYKIAFGVYAF